MKLTALRPNNPVAVMAAYGALRLLPGATLRWDGPHPELAWDGDIVAALAARLPERLAAPELNLIDDPRQIDGAAGYRALAERMPTEWLVAYAAETDKKIRRTDLLIMLDGPHQFIANARKIMLALSRLDVTEKLSEALLGPWRYEQRDFQAWGWDADARIDSSSSVKAVTSAPKFGVFGAYWLAWESLPFWPMVNGQTIGMDRHHWVYPTCANWLGAEGLRALILGAGGMNQREKTALVVSLWCSERIKSGKYGVVLGWSAPLSARTASDREKSSGLARTKNLRRSIA